MEILEVFSYKKRERWKSKKNLIKSLIVINNYGKSEVIMDKAILIIDMPSCCKDCPLCVSEELFPSFDEYSCIVENVAVDVYDKPDWCPLKPAAVNI